MNKKFIWIGLRISFWLMIGLWIAWFLIAFGTIPANETAGKILGLLWLVAIIASLIISIIHLNMHKEKALAICALVASSLIIIAQVAYLILDNIPCSSA